MKIDEVLDEYRQGDAEQRMSMFLYHRELRDEFACIEQDDPADLSMADRTAEPIRQSMVRKVLFMLRDRSCWSRSKVSEGRAGQSRALASPGSRRGWTALIRSWHE